MALATRRSGHLSLSVVHSSCFSIAEATQTIVTADEQLIVDVVSLQISLSRSR